MLTFPCSKCCYITYITMLNNCFLLLTSGNKTVKHNVPQNKADPKPWIFNSLGCSWPILTMSIPLACYGDRVAFWKSIQSLLVFSKLDQNNPCKFAVHLLLMRGLVMGLIKNRFISNFMDSLIERESFICSETQIGPSSVTKQWKGIHIHVDTSCW